MRPRRNVTSVQRSSPDVICSSGNPAHTNGFVDRGMAMGDIRLIEKRGGKSGDYIAP